MGEPAARALIDKAAHGGRIQAGSPDVIIGGFPAARKNDPVNCPEHGSSIIVSGSASVWVNGLPLARQNDQTQCNGSATAVSPKAHAVPPQYWGGTLAKSAGEDGALHGKLYDARVLGVYASAEDKHSAGSSDTVSAGFALEDITVGNMNSEDLLKGEVRTKMAVANVGGSMVLGQGDYASMSANATATALQYGGSASAGKQGSLYGGVGGDFTAGTAEAKASSEVYKGNKGRYGFAAELGAEAAAAKGEATANIDILGVIVADGKLGGSVGSVGASAGLTAFIDETDYSVNIKASGELALALGLKADAGLKVMIKPLVDWVFGDSEDTPSSSTAGDGIIETGCVTVLVGN
jgi:uncharacterized Zn-binding protein involved in type VI secretion